MGQCSRNTWEALWSITSLGVRTLDNLDEWRVDALLWGSLGRKLLETAKRAFGKGLVGWLTEQGLG